MRGRKVYKNVDQKVVAVHQTTEQWAFIFQRSSRRKFLRSNRVQRVSRLEIDEELPHARCRLPVHSALRRDEHLNWHAQFGAHGGQLFAELAEFSVRFQAGLVGQEDDPVAVLVQLLQLRWNLVVEHFPVFGVLWEHVARFRRDDRPVHIKGSYLDMRQLFTCQSVETSG